MCGVCELKYVASGPAIPQGTSALQKIRSEKPQSCITYLSLKKRKVFFSPTNSQLFLHSTSKLQPLANMPSCFQIRARAQNFGFKSDSTVRTPCTFLSSPCPCLQLLNVACERPQGRKATVLSPHRNRHPKVGPDPRR